MYTSFFYFFGAKNQWVAGGDAVLAFGYMGVHEPAGREIDSQIINVQI